MYKKAIVSKKKQNCNFATSFDKEDEKDEMDLFWFFMNEVVPHAPKQQQQQGILIVVQVVSHNVR